MLYRAQIITVLRHSAVRQAMTVHISLAGRDRHGLRDSV